MRMRLEMPWDHGSVDRKAGRNLWFVVFATVVVLLLLDVDALLRPASIVLATYAPASLRPVETRPGWSSRLSDPVAAGWSRIQSDFHLTDNSVERALELLESNGRYSESRALQDLALYPDEVERAFALIAKSRAPTPADLGALSESLRNSLVEEAFDELVVYSVVHLLYSDAGEPKARELVASLANAAAFAGSASRASPVSLQ